MALERYHAKRDFSKTPEPQGRPKKGKSKKLAFVVQEHHASQLHYDFRLELDGVLKSWAVPKGPSTNPHDRHLAIMTEDHPYEYRKFEGVIPKGHYGAGNVIIWDEGTYEPYHDDKDDIEKIIKSELKKGHLTFFLNGKKLNGEFALIKMHGADENAWLLIKKGDEFANAKNVLKQDQSVKSGKTVDEMNGGPPPKLEEYPKISKPWVVKPMLATLVDEVFDGDEWIFEVKWDGYRAIAAKHKGEIDLYSRNQTDFRDHYPAVVEAVRACKHDVIFDGEIVILDDNGRPHFEWIQQYRQQPIGHLHYYAFDILWCDGHDVRTMPLVERKKLLKSVLPEKNIVIRYGDYIEKTGTKLFGEMRRQGLEGIIAKKAQSDYTEEIRSRNWLKVKTGLRQEVVIGGYTEPRGSRTYIGSLVVGVYEKGDLVYVGHSGGGIPDNQRQTLLKKLQKLERKSSPFIQEPKPNAPVHWVRPELVCEMSFSEWTHDGSMRHPQFEGLRSDKDPKKIHREKARAVKTTGTKEQSMSKEKLEFTHLDKIFFPKHKYTKGDLIEYYRSVVDYMLPYLKDRPHSLNRHPNGVTGESFYQKNNPHLPAWVPHEDIYSDSNQENLRWVVGKDLDTLLYMVQLGCIEINPWNSRVGHLQKPDWVVMDLDPEGIGFKEVVAVAKTVKAVCDELKIPSYPKTSGKTGIHIFIPLGAKYTHEQARNLAHLIAIEVNKRQPKTTSVERMPEKRKHKIYVDFLQNREGQTLAAPYSVRPTPDATVSMPLHWDEVKPSLKPTDFTIQNAKKRLGRTGDLWKPILGKGIDLAKVIKSFEAKA